MRRLLALLGSDVGASLSPLLHAEAARALGLDVAYVPVSCKSAADFDAALEALKTLAAIGCNVTLPYKARAFERCEQASTTAQEIGAVNTISFSPAGAMLGDNTDGPGLLRLLEVVPARRLERVQLLGSGGAARAAAWALARLAPGSVHVCARRGSEPVAALCRGQLAPLGPVAGASLVISALPADRTLAHKVLHDWIDPKSEPLVLDLAYGGLEGDSPLALAARAAGLQAVDGRVLLVEQAALALSLWTGGEVSRIRLAMRGALKLPPEGLPGIPGPGS